MQPTYPSFNTKTHKRPSIHLSVNLPSLSYPDLSNTNTGPEAQHSNTYKKNKWPKSGSDPITRSSRLVDIILASTITKRMLCDNHRVGLYFQLNNDHFIKQTQCKWRCNQRTQCNLFGPTMQVLCFLQGYSLHIFDSTIQKPRTWSHHFHSKYHARYSPPWSLFLYMFSFVSIACAVLASWSELCAAEPMNACNPFTHIPFVALSHMPMQLLVLHITVTYSWCFWF
jgi:hypothetical protein